MTTRWPHQRSRRIGLHGPVDGRAVDLGNILVVQNPVTGGRYSLDRERREVTVSIDSATARGSLDELHMVRGVLLGAAFAGGCEPMHAACVTLEGVGVLLLGRKGSGKTTFALALLEKAADSSATLVTNDKALVVPGTGQVIGLPFAAAIGKETLAALHLDPRQEWREVAGKWLVWPSELSRLLGRGITRSADVRIVCECSLDPRMDTVAITELSPNPVTVESIGDFGYSVIPRWLFEELGWPSDGLVGRVDHVRHLSLHGNPLADGAWVDRLAEFAVSPWP